MPGHYQGNIAEEQPARGQDTRHKGQCRRGRGALHERHDHGGLDARVRCDHRDEDTGCRRPDPGQISMREQLSRGDVQLFLHGTRVQPLL